MKKVTDLSENEVIHCQTLKEAEAICKLMHEAGLKWNDGDSYINTNWNVFQDCYNPKKGTHDRIEFCRKKGYTIHPASDFLAPSLSELIDNLKKQAKSEGMECDVVLKEIPKRIEVTPNGSRGSNETGEWVYNFNFNFNRLNRNRFGAYEMHTEVLPFLAKQLEKYLNKEIK